MTSPAQVAKMLQPMDSELVTILFTGSSTTADDARRAQFAQLRAVVAEHGGREIKTTGDGLMIAFASAVAAVRCAVALQRQAGAPLRVGLAAGECVAEGDDLFGTPVLVAARLCDVAAVGEILATDVVRQLGGAPMAPAGTLRLAGVPERVVAAQVRWRDEPEEEEEVAPARETTVVVADDQRLLRTGFRVILDAEPDITVVGEAADGRSAIDVVRRRRPDVVLMDIRMPELDGLQAAELLLADPEVQTAVVMLTTFDLDEYIYEALRIGASGFLLKDTPSDRLLDAVRVAAAGEALLAPSITRRLIAKFTHAARPAPGAVPDELADLTARELDVLRLVADGLSNTEIAARLVLGENTVKTHVAHVLAKLGLRDRVQAVVLAYQTGFITGDSRP
jgi:DNA-binding NarL/FixJ family response regulator